MTSSTGAGRAFVLSLLWFSSQDSDAGKILDYIRNYDLNNYALGFAVTTSQSPYAGDNNSTYGYPYLTTFTNAAFTDDWLLVNDGDLGVRWVSPGDWVLGVVGRVDTGGFGDTDSAALEGVFQREWAVEVGPLVGWRRWPIQLEYKLYAEILTQNEGLTSEFTVSWPTQRSWGYLVPYLKLRHQDASYNDFYFGVSPEEATPERPAYSPGASNNLVAQIRAGYAIGERWLLTGYVESEWLGSAIVMSPIVDKHQLWSFNLGVAYNADLFQPRQFTGETYTAPVFEFRFSAFRNNIKSSILQKSEDGEITDVVDIEDTLGLPDLETVWQFDGIARIGRFHRIDFGYYELGRSGSKELQAGFASGGATFNAGETVNSRSSAKIAKVTYGYSLMSDAQKELGVTAGLHVTKIETEIVSPDTGQVVHSNVSTPLPVIGAFASVYLGRKIELEARLSLFRLDFDSYEGSLNYAYLGVLQHVENLGSIGLGYSYYAIHLGSNNEGLNGTLRMEHYGPLVFVSVNF